MTLRFGDGLTPHDFDSFDHRKEHLKRIDDVDDVMDDNSLSDAEQKKKMEELGFIRYSDAEYSPEEQLFFDIDMIQDSWNKDVFSDLLQTKDLLISKAEIKNFMSKHPNPLASYYSDTIHPSHTALHFLVTVNTALFDNDDFTPEMISKNPDLRKFLIAVWMYVLAIVKARKGGEQHLLAMQSFLSLPQTYIDEAQRKKLLAFLV